MIKGIDSKVVLQGSKKRNARLSQTILKFNHLSTEINSSLEKNEK